jgi:hypothetical protein
MVSGGRQKNLEEKKIQGIGGRCREIQVMEDVARASA